MAVAHLYTAYKEELASLSLSLLQTHEKKSLRTLVSMMENRINSPPHLQHGPALRRRCFHCRSA